MEKFATIVHISVFFSVFFSCHHCAAICSDAFRLVRIVYVRDIIIVNGCVFHCGNLRKWMAHCLAKNLSNNQRQRPKEKRITTNALRKYRFAGPGQSNWLKTNGTDNRILWQPEMANKRSNQLWIAHILQCDIFRYCLYSVRYVCHGKFNSMLSFNIWIGWLYQKVAI